MHSLKNTSRGAAFGGGAVVRSGAEKPMAETGKKIARTSAGLRDSLFDALERVRDGEMMAEDAKAISMLAGQICNTVNLEIQVAKLRTEYPADAKLIVPSPLQLGIPDDEAKK